MAEKGEYYLGERSPGKIVAEKRKSS